MNRTDFENELKLAAQNGTLMTPKHDPGQLSTTYKTFRTVLSYDLAANLEAFIVSREYDVEKFENYKFPTSPDYFVLTPALLSTFSIPTSGVDAESPAPTVALDRIVVVNGANQGYHMFGESSINIQKKVSDGDLISKQKM